MEEAASGAVGLLRDTDDSDRTLLDGLSAGIVVKVGCGLAGADGVDRDLCVAQLPGEIHSSHIRRGLRSVIAERFHHVQGRGRIAVKTQGSKAAVRGQGAFQRPDRNGALRTVPAGKIEDAGVVDEHVQVTELLFDLLRKGRWRLQPRNRGLR